ncbi:uncharacterized protein LOC112343800 [Selaginella moellendorffii]|uniref:uncharacterized protein LOC112343800 n=1 Tax=Selaginella moellendorffii TaxID=88036 RepID=UPI000D1C2D94|nr:uncharacterized protein LOC112343800 [Selaginella moellendorffii]|eukprot:XP_024523600.1 uncharacterized protein LOC112343800 [Selaginella moellendorffii]
MRRGARFRGLLSSLGVPPSSADRGPCTPLRPEQMGRGRPRPARGPGSGSHRPPECPARAAGSLAGSYSSEKRPLGRPENPIKMVGCRGCLAGDEKPASFLLHPSPPHRARLRPCGRRVDPPAVRIIASMVFVCVASPRRDRPKQPPLWAVRERTTGRPALLGLDPLPSAPPSERPPAGWGKPRRLRPHRRAAPRTDDRYSIHGGRPTSTHQPLWRVVSDPHENPLGTGGAWDARRCVATTENRARTLPGIVGPTPPLPRGSPGAVTATPYRDCSSRIAPFVPHPPHLMVGVITNKSPSRWNSPGQRALSVRAGGRWFLLSTPGAGLLVGRGAFAQPLLGGGPRRPGRAARPKQQGPRTVRPPSPPARPGAQAKANRSLSVSLPLGRGVVQRKRRLTSVVPIRPPSTSHHARPLPPFPPHSSSPVASHSPLSPAHHPKPPALLRAVPGAGACWLTRRHCERERLVGRRLPALAVIGDMALFGVSISVWLAAAGTRLTVFSPIQGWYVPTEPPTDHHPSGGIECGL